MCIRDSGQRVRVAGSAEIGGEAARQSERAQATLDKVLDDWFPGVTRRDAAQRWKGARPMLPDGPPVLGASGAEGIWLNVGHGGSGWALAVGSVSYTHLRAHETPEHLVCRLLLEK